MTQVNSTESALDWLSLLDAVGYDSLLTQIAHTDKPLVVGFLNQHAYNLIEQRADVRDSFEKIDCLLRDGIGIKMACKLNGLYPGLNLNGTDFIPNLIARLGEGTPRPIQYFAFGTQEPWLTLGAEALTGSRDIVSLDGFQSPGMYVDMFKARHIASSLAVIILAMGMPKQEQVAQLLKAQITGPAIIVCGGAILDFASGRVDRAPEIMRRTGTEWLYRLCKEPKRLCQRYVIGIPVFFMYVLRNIMRGEATQSATKAGATTAVNPSGRSEQPVLASQARPEASPTGNPVKPAEQVSVVEVETPNKVSTRGQ